VIDRLAKTGDPRSFPLPEGQVSVPEGGYHRYDSSFSGLKTATLRLVQKLEQTGETLPVNDLAASFQATVARALTKRAIACALDYGLETIVVGGGVAANSALREQIQAAAAKHSIRVVLPPLYLCGDNAAMIACAAADHLNRGHTSALTLGARSRLAVSDVMELYQA
jgi:N6-L-threonylcarbamoyladenine synthase